MISVEHNPERLNCRYVVNTTNARACEAFIQRFMAERRPRGLRVRHSPDVVKNVMYLETRDSYAMDCILSAMRDAGYVKKAKRQ